MPIFGNINRIDIKRKFIKNQLLIDRLKTVNIWSGLSGLKATLLYDKYT